MRRKYALKHNILQLVPPQISGKYHINIFRTRLLDAFKLDAEASLKIVFVYALQVKNQTCLFPFRKRECLWHIDLGHRQSKEIRLAKRIDIPNSQRTVTVALVREKSTWKVNSIIFHSH